MTNPTPEPHPPPLSTAVTVGIVIAALAAVTLLSLILWVFRRQRLRKSQGASSRTSHKLYEVDAEETSKFEIDAEENAKVEIDGLDRPPELHDEARVEVDAGIAAHEVIDKATAVHELP